MKHQWKCFHCCFFERWLAKLSDALLHVLSLKSFDAVSASLSLFFLSDVTANLSLCGVLEIHTKQNIFALEPGLDLSKASSFRKQWCWMNFLSLDVILYVCKKN